MLQRQAPRRSANQSPPNATGNGGKSHAAQLTSLFLKRRSAQPAPHLLLQSLNRKLMRHQLLRDIRRRKLQQTNWGQDSQPPQQHRPLLPCRRGAWYMMDPWPSMGATPLKTANHSCLRRVHVSCCPSVATGHPWQNPAPCQPLWLRKIHAHREAILLLAPAAISSPSQPLVPLRLRELYPRIHQGTACQAALQAGLRDSRRPVRTSTRHLCMAPSLLRPTPRAR